MSVPMKYTASELAEALKQYGDLPVSVEIVHGDGSFEREVQMLRLELSTAYNGERFVSIAGYEDDEEKED